MPHLFFKTVCVSPGVLTAGLGKHCLHQENPKAIAFKEANGSQGWATAAYPSDPFFSWLGLVGKILQVLSFFYGLAAVFNRLSPPPRQLANPKDRLRLLSEALAQLPRARVVLSSTWRLDEAAASRVQLPSNSLGPPVVPFSSFLRRVPLLK